MKILFITRGRSSRGGHVVITEIVRGLRNENYDVTLTTFESKEKMKENIPCWDNLDVNFVEVPHSIERDTEQITHIEAASKYIKENVDKFDRIIVDSWFIALAIIRAGIFSDKIFQFVQSDSAFAPDSESEFWKSELFNFLPLISMNRIVVSRALADFFEKKYDKKFNSIQLFLNQKYLDASFNVKNKNVLNLVSSSATFNIKTKGLKFLLEELEKFENFKFELTLISGARIEKDLNKYSFPINIKSAKNADEMIEELCNHDVYVNTSTKEAFPLALAEALAVGMPSIALDSVGNREYMDGKNAIFVENSDNFSSELERMKDFEFRKQISKKAKTSMQKYTLDNTLVELKKILII